MGPAEIVDDVQAAIVSLPERDFKLRKTRDVWVGEVVDYVYVGGRVFLLPHIEFMNDQSLQAGGSNYHSLKFGMIAMLYLDVQVVK